MRDEVVAARARELFGRTVEWRRAIHSKPELAWQENATSDYIVEQLRGLDLEIERAGTGVLATLRGGGAGADERAVLLRADIDALPILEQSNVPYRSQNSGVMHACGHDAHTAVLLGAAHLLSGMREQLPGSVRFCFQPAEELEREDGLSGGEFMIQSGALAGVPVGACFALHCSPDYAAGSIGVNLGPAAQAAADSFEIIIHGEGSHASQPHRSVDPVVVACYAVTMLQTIVSRQVAPMEAVVLTVASIQGGGIATNIIGDTAVLRGTVRTLNEEVRGEMPQRMDRMLAGVCNGFGATHTLHYQRGYPVLVNDPAMAQLSLDVARAVVGEDGAVLVPPRLGAEDFAYYLQARPGCMFRLGTGGPGKEYNLHTSRFDVDESCLPIGVEMMAGVALAYLRGA